MKIRFKEFPALSIEGIPYSKVKDAEYLVLGIEREFYHYLDDDNHVSMLNKDLFEITDDTRPEFWVDDDGRAVPEEWRWKNYFSLDGEPYCEWDEIWNIVQFAKGLEKFNLQSFPDMYKKAYDVDLKEGLVAAYLTIAAQYDSLPSIHMVWDYKFSSFNGYGGLPYYPDDPIPYEQVPLTTADKCGFDVLKDILKQIGSSYEHDEGLRVDTEWLQNIRNRILFSIWSIWGTNIFEVFELDHRKFRGKYYLLQKDEQRFLISFNYYT